MTEKDLRKLGRTDLLEMLIAQTKENDALKEQIAQMQNQLDNREIAIEKTGSIAEASLQLNSVFEAAQQAAEQYLENIRHAERISRDVEAQTKEKCAQIIAEAQEAAAQIKKTAQQEVDAYWENMSGRLQTFRQQHDELEEIMQLNFDK